MSLSSSRALSKLIEFSRLVLQGIESGREHGEAGDRRQMCGPAGKLVLRQEFLSSFTFRGVFFVESSFLQHARIDLHRLPCNTNLSGQSITRQWFRTTADALKSSTAYTTSFACTPPAGTSGTSGCCRDKFTAISC